MQIRWISSFALPLLFASASAAVEVHGVCWIDRNEDGIRQATEGGVVRGIVGRVYYPDSGFGYYVSSLENGAWSRQSFPLPSVVLDLEVPTIPATFTAANAGSDDAKDSDIDPITRSSGRIEVDGRSVVQIDAGIVVEKGTAYGRVWLDANRNGLRDGAETWLSGASGSVRITSADTGAVSYSTIFPDGSWFSELLPEGDYEVRMNLDSSVYALTAANQGSDDEIDSDFIPSADFPARGAVTIHVQDHMDIRCDAGALDQRGTVSGRVWVDANRNGLQDAGEGAPWSATITVDGTEFQVGSYNQNDGSWTSGLLSPGTHSVRIQYWTDFFRLTTPGAGDEESDSDFGNDPLAIDYNQATVTILANHPVVDAGLIDRRASIQGRFWLDANKDGIRQAGETAVPPGTTISVSQNPYGGLVIPLITVSADGTWSSSLLPVGNYLVRATLNGAVYGFTASNVGDDAYDSDVVTPLWNPLSNEATSAVVLAENSLTIDVGVIDRRATISGRIWLDENMDGQQDAGETTSSRGSVYIWSSTGPAQFITPTNGLWTSPLLPPGNYLVSVNLYPGEGIFTTADAGNDATDSDFTWHSVVSTGGSKFVTLAGSDIRLDAGVVNQPGSVSGRIWLDRDADGIRTADEGVAAAPMGALFIRPNGGVETAVAVAADGSWSFGPITPGSAQVRFELAAGLNASPVVTGGNSRLDPITLKFNAPVVPATMTERMDIGVCGPALNDNFAKAQVLTGLTGSVTGSSLWATHETGEPVHVADTVASHSVWYAWTAPATGTVTVDTLGSDFNTLLAAYVGEDIGSAIRLRSNNNISTTIKQSRISSHVTAGRTYRFAVDGSVDSSGAIVLNWTLAPTPPANDNFAKAQVLTGLTGSVTGSSLWATHETGEPVHVADTVASHSVWYAWTAPATGTVTVDTLGSDFNTLLAAYVGEDIGSAIRLRSNNNISTTIKQSRISSHVTAGRTYRFAVDGSVDSSGVIVLNWTLVPTPPANDDFAKARILTGLTGSVTGSSLWATRETGEPNHVDATTGSHSLWYAWTATATGIVTVDTLGSDFNTLLAAYTGGAFDSLTRITANNNISATVKQSRISFRVTAGTTYRIVVDGSGSGCGAVSLTWSFVPTGSG